jgi:hypothetical protein
VPADFIEKKTKDSRWGMTQKALLDRGQAALKSIREGRHFKHINASQNGAKEVDGEKKGVQYEHVESQNGKEPSEDYTIVIVSHSGFMREAVTGSWWHNADYRIFDFDDEGQGPESDLRLKQWELTSKSHWNESANEEQSGGLGVSWAQTTHVGDFPAHYPER